MVSGVSKFYRLKDNLDHSVPEQNRTEYYFNKNNRFFITQKGYNWFKTYSDILQTDNNRQKPTSKNDVVIYQNQIIELYKQRIEYLETENKRLLDIIAFKEQKEALQKAIDENKSTDELKKLSDELQQTMFSISQKAYEKVQKEGETAQSSDANSSSETSSKSDDDVIDAEYVKE